MKFLLIKLQLMKFKLLLLIIFLFLFNQVGLNADSTSLSFTKFQNINDNFYSNENLDSLYEEINQSLSYAESAEKKIEILKNLAEKYKSINIQRSVVVYRMALEVAEKSKNKLLLITTLVNLANYEIISKNYQKAYDLLSKAQKLNNEEDKNNESNLSKSEKVRITAEISNIFGLLSFYTENYREAIDFYKDAIEIKVEQNDSSDVDLYFRNIGEVYKKTQNYKNALDNITKALEISKSRSNKLREAENTKLLAEIYFQQNDFIKCLKYFNISKDLYLAIGDDEKTSEIMIDLGYVLFKFADYYKSIAHLKRGIDLAEKVNNNSLKKQGYHFLHTVYYKSGDFRKAYEALQKYSEINENLKLSEINKTLSEMQIKLDFDKKATVQKAKDEVSLLTYSLIFVIIILVILNIYFFINRLKNQKIYDALIHHDD